MSFIKSALVSSFLKSLKGINESTHNDHRQRANFNSKKSKELNFDEINDMNEDDGDERDDMVNDEDFMLSKPVNDSAQKIIKGGSSIKQYHILNDKRFIIAKDTSDNVFVYDVLKVLKSLSFYLLFFSQFLKLKAKEVEFLGKENFEEVIKSRQKFISVPNWFTVDLKLGVCSSFSFALVLFNNFFFFVLDFNN